MNIIDKIHDGLGNLAEIEAEPNGKQFVRLLRSGVSQGEIVRGEYRNNVVYGIRDEGRTPDIAYACFQGTPDEVKQFLAEKGFVKERVVQWFFLAHETVTHPETRESVIEKDVAYSVAAFTAKCDEMGIDNVRGQMVELECARAFRRDNKITRFVLLRSENQQESA